MDPGFLAEPVIGPRDFPLARPRNDEAAGGNYASTLPLTPFAT